jgi:hypothetical protein
VEDAAAVLLLLLLVTIAGAASFWMAPMRFDRSAIETAAGRRSSWPRAAREIRLSHTRSPLGAEGDEDITARGTLRRVARMLHELLSSSSRIGSRSCATSCSCSGGGCTRRDAGSPG